MSNIHKEVGQAIVSLEGLLKRKAGALFGQKLKRIEQLLANRQQIYHYFYKGKRESKSYKGMSINIQVTIKGTTQNNLEETKQANINLELIGNSLPLFMQTKDVEDAGKFLDIITDNQGSNPNAHSVNQALEHCIASFNDLCVKKAASDKQLFNTHRGLSEPKKNWEQHRVADPTQKVQTINEKIKAIYQRFPSLAAREVTAVAPTPPVKHTHAHPHTHTSTTAPKTDSGSSVGGSLLI